MIKKLRLQLGLRGEQTNTTGNLVTTNEKNDKHYFNLFPTVGLMYMKSPNHIFSLNYKSSIYRPTYSFLNPFIIYQNQYTYSQGNPNIQPMIFNKVSFAYSYHQFLNISLSYLHVQKMISVVYLQGADNTVIQSYDNLNHGDVFNLTVSAQKQIGVWQTSLTGIGGYAHYVNSSSSNSTNSSLVGVLQWQNSFAFKHGWSVEAFSVYRAPMASNALELKQAFQTDLGLNKTLFKGDGSLKISVTDVFNSGELNTVYDNQGITTSTNSHDETRFVNLIFRYKFGNKHIKANQKHDTGISDLQQRMGN